MSTTSDLRLLDPSATAAVLLGASDWRETCMGVSPSFHRSAKGILNYLVDPAGLRLNRDLVLDLFDDSSSASEQLVRIRDKLENLFRKCREVGRPVSDVVIYYIGHGTVDEQGHLTLLIKHTRRGLEAETGIKAPDLARVLRVSAPQQRRLVVLDCCFAEAAARAFIGMGALDQAVAAAAAKDISEALPTRGGLLLCSSPVGETSIGPPNAERTLFTGAVIDVLREGAEGRPTLLSFSDLRDEAYDRMLIKFGANTPRPVLHPVNQTQGDLTRLPAFPNRAPLPQNPKKGYRDPQDGTRLSDEQRDRERADRELGERADREAKLRIDREVKKHESRNRINVSKSWDEYFNTDRSYKLICLGFIIAACFTEFYASLATLALVGLVNGRRTWHNEGPLMSIGSGLLTCIVLGTIATALHWLSLPNETSFMLR